MEQGTHIHTYTYTRTHTHIHTHAHIHVHTHTHRYLLPKLKQHPNDVDGIAQVFTDCVSSLTHTHAHAHTHAHTHATHKHTYIPLHAHTVTHTHMHNTHTHVHQADEMASVYVPFCMKKSASEELLASHRTYLSVSASVVQPERICTHHDALNLCMF